MDAPVRLRSRQGKEFIFVAEVADIPWYLLKTYESNDACFVGCSFFVKLDGNGIPKTVWMSFAYDTETRPAPVEQEPDSGPIVAIAVAVPVVLLSCLIVVAVLYMHMSRAKNEE